MIDTTAFSSSFPDGHNFHRVRTENPYEGFIRTDQSSQSATHAPVKKLIAGICGALLLGYLLRTCYLKYMRDSKAESAASATVLHKIALESGRTEYDLFLIAAEKWSISEAQINKDFRNYMASNVLPYYVMDLVRKNNDRVDKSLEKKTR